MHFCKSYLSGRTFQVRCGLLSDVFEQEHGLVQGGVLSPLLFNVAIDALMSFLVMCLVQYMLMIARSGLRVVSCTASFGDFNEHCSLWANGLVTMALSSQQRSHRECFFDVVYGGWT